MPTGTVKWFNVTKGFGFIAPEDGSKDVFVHISAVERAGLGTLREAQRINYEVRPGRDGRTCGRRAFRRRLGRPPTPETDQGSTKKCGVQICAGR